jgi:hypothetical protein
MNEPANIRSRRVVICADDYGISPAVSAGIRELAAAGRLSATGVMTCMPDWPAEARPLRPLGQVISIGLHLTLTDQCPLGPMPDYAPDGRFPTIGRLLEQSRGGRVPRPEIAAELDRQLDCFEAHFGRPPDFVDGHHHVHLLKGVREAVLGAFGRRLDPAKCWLRDCTDRLGCLLSRRLALKAGFIAMLGMPLHRAARARGIATNHGFSGFYDAGRQRLDEVFPTLLAGAADGHLVMLHPGHVDAALAVVDRLTESRQAEWDFLMGDAAPRLLAQRGLTIAGRGLPLAG